MTAPEPVTPNRWVGRNGQRVVALVLHITDGDTAAGALAWFRSPHSQVSAHYVVDRDGAVLPVVDEADTAWANGRLARPNLANPLIAGWAAAGLNPNWVTLSIEVVGRPGAPWPVAQRAAVARLIADGCRRHGLSIDRTHVIGHGELDGVTRARCPGLTEGQWDTLLAEARAHATDPTGGFSVGAGIRAALAAAGDVALGPERYLRAADGGEVSVVAGRDALYVWSADGGGVYRVGRP